MDSKSPDPYDYDYQAYLLAKALEPEETMVVCCPRYVNLRSSNEIEELNANPFFQLYDR